MVYSDSTICHNKNGTSDGYSFSSSNYKAGKCGSGHNLKGDIPQGDVTYDAATANIGSPWKMFTQDQFEELINNTTNGWTTINGVNGWRFDNKSDSSKYIFLPAVGYWKDTTHNIPGSYAVYWYTVWYDSSRARSMNFTSSEVRLTSVGNRFLGESVRGIQ